MKTTFKFGPGDPNWGQQIQMSLCKIQPRFKTELNDFSSPQSLLLKKVCEQDFTLDEIKELHTYTEEVAHRMRDHYQNAEYPEHLKEAAMDDSASVSNTVFDAYTYVHEHIQSPITTPKLLGLVALLAFLATGCTTVYTAQGPGHCDQDGQIVRHKSGWLTPPHSLVNNTPYILDVFQNGKQIYQDLETGQVLPIGQPLTIALNYTVTVVGHTSQGEYAGSRTWYYRNGYPEVWTITRLHKPSYD